MPTLTKLFAPLLARFSAAGKPAEVQPARDWLFMLLAACVCALCGAGYGLYSFVRLGQVDSPTTVGTVGATVALDRSALQNTVSRYRERAVRFEELRVRASDVPSPGGEAASSQRSISTPETTTPEDVLVPNP